MTTTVMKNILSSNIKSYLHINLSLLKSNSTINKVQMRRCVQRLHYEDYVNIQNYYHVNNEMKENIRQSLISKLSGYDNCYMTETNIIQLIQYTYDKIKSFDISLHHNNQFYYTDIYNKELEKLDTKKEDKHTKFDSTNKKIIGHDAEQYCAIFGLKTTSYT